MWSHRIEGKIKRRNRRKGKWNTSTISLANRFDWSAQWSKWRAYQLEDKEWRNVEWSQHIEENQWERDEI